MYQVILLNQARKDLKKIDQRYQLKVLQSLRLLKTTPFLGEKMTGDFQGCYRIKIPPVRIIYTPRIKNKIILVKAIAHRQGVYRN